MSTSTTFIRVKPERFLYVVGVPLTDRERLELTVAFEDWWPGARLMVIAADEYVDLTGQPVDLVTRADLAD